MDYYQILNISANASDREIKLAYRTLIKKFHPDRNPSEQAREFTAQLNQAYDVLSDPVKRSQYDNRFYQALSEPVREEDPREIYRREYIARKKREDEAARRHRAEWQKNVFRIMRMANFAILAFAVLHAIDYSLPVRTYKEPPIREWAEQRGGGRHTYTVSMIQTAHFTFRVSSKLYAGYHFRVDDPQPLFIHETAMLRIPRAVSYEDDKKMTTLELPDTVYSFGPLKPLFLLGITLGILLLRRYNAWTFQLSFMPASVLFFIKLVI